MEKKYEDHARVPRQRPAHSPEYVLIYEILIKHIYNRFFTFPKIYIQEETYFLRRITNCIASKGNTYKLSQNMYTLF